MTFLSVFLLSAQPLAEHESSSQWYMVLLCTVYYSLELYNVLLQTGRALTRGVEALQDPIVPSSLLHAR